MKIKLAFASVFEPFARGCGWAVKVAPMPDNEDGIDWSLTTWDGVTREQLRRWAALSLEEIVQAQEEMQELAARLGTSGLR